MDKKLIALAVASLFVAPMAMADNSSVVISGQLHVSVDSLDGGNHAGLGGANTGNTRQTNVSTNASFLSFDGKEDLGNGLNAIWKLKTYVSLGGTGNSGDPFNANPNDGFTNGPAYAGLAGASWGALKLGKDESPMKVLSRKTDLFINQIGDTRNLSSEFETRPNNAIEYNSPNMGGFSVNAMYSTNLTTAAPPYAGAGVTSTSSANTFATSNSVSLRSVNAMYDAGPFFIGLGYETHSLSDLRLTNPASTLKDESAWRVAAGANFGGFKLVGSYERNRDFKGINNADFNFYGVGGAYKMGSNTIKAQFYKATSLDTATTTPPPGTGGGAKMYAIGFDHALSKRTTAYLAYARTNNDSNAAFSAFGGGHGDNPGTATGQNPSGFSVGMIHNF